MVPSILNIGYSELDVKMTTRNHHDSQRGYGCGADVAGDVVLLLLGIWCCCCFRVDGLLEVNTKIIDMNAKQYKET